MDYTKEIIIKTEKRIVIKSNSEISGGACDIWKKLLENLSFEQLNDFPNKIWIKNKEN